MRSAHRAGIWALVLMVGGLALLITPGGPVEEAGALEVSTLTFADASFDPDGFDGDRIVQSPIASQLPFFLRYNIQYNGRAPFTIRTDWGDGTIETATTVSSAFFASHDYADPFAAVITRVWRLTITDAADSVYEQALNVRITRDLGLLTYNFAATIAGIPAPTGVTRRVGVDLDLTVFVLNTGSNTLSSVSVIWAVQVDGAGGFTDFDAQTVATNTLPIHHGTVFAVATHAIPSSGLVTVPDVIRATVTGHAQSDAPTIVLSNTNSALSPTMSVTAAPTTITTVVGLPVAFELTLTGDPNYMIVPDAVALDASPSLSVIPTNPGRGVLNISGFFSNVLNQFSPAIILGVNGTISIPVSVVASVPGTYTITFDFQPRSADGVYIGARVPVSMTIIVGEAGAIVTTVSVTFLTTSPIIELEFSGKVIVLGAATYIDVHFQFRNTTTGSTDDFVSVPQVPIRVTTPQTFVFARAQAAASINVTMEFIGVDSLGNVVFGGPINFETPAIGGVPTVGGEITSNPFEGMLRAFGQVTGVSPEIIGLLFGMMLLFFFLIVLAIFGLPWQVQIISLILISAVNVFLFLWPSWVIAILAVFGGVLIFREFTATGSNV